LADKVDHVMLVGHDPGIHDLAHMLSGAGDIALRRLLSIKFPTCGAAVIDFTTNRWRDIAPGTGTLRHFMAPKRLPG
ncbi:MAG: histidine phosphatase family protein, partial [Hyphomicrobiaceae bacterium]